MGIGSIIIYLDQFQWIDLARAFYGKNSTESAKQILPKIIKATESGRATFPLSLFTLIETEKRADEPSRHRLAEFLVKISRGYVIVPDINIRSSEIAYAMMKRLGAPLYQVSVIKRGLPNLLGGITGISGNISEELKGKLIEEAHNPEWILFALNDKELSKEIRATYNKPDKILDILERLRLNDSQVKDRTERYYGTMVRFFTLWINKKMARISVKLKIPVGAIKYSDRNDVESYFRMMPSLYCLFNLTFARDLEKTRKIASNDGADIHALAVAIPYCDVVLTEAFWVKNAKQQGLDRTYGTKILSSFKELEPLLD